MLKRLPPMLDNPEKTAHLLAALKAAMPFEVELPPMVINQLQADKVAAGHQARQTVSDLSYLGDEGGIICSTRACDVVTVSTRKLGSPSSCTCSPTLLASW